MKGSACMSSKKILMTADRLKRVDVRDLKRFRLHNTVYPQIRESLTPESQIVGTVTPQLINRLSRYAVDLPRKEEMERFIAQLSKELEP